MKKEFYAKSFEEDFILKTIKGKKKVKFQSIQNILKTKTIKPNTKSFGREKRLACSLLNKNYLKTYRAQGIIFQTSIKPDFVYPFDIVILSNAKKIIVQYYRIKDNLHIYYNHNLLPGFDKFVFKSSKEMIKKFPSPKTAWEKANKFRKEHGFEILPKQKYKLVEYNEIIFHKPIKIKPIAIFGYKKITKEISKKYNLPCFRTAKEFWNKHHNNF